LDGPAQQPQEVDTKVLTDFEAAGGQEAGQNLRVDQPANPREEQAVEREEESGEGVWFHAEAGGEGSSQSLAKGAEDPNPIPTIASFGGISSCLSVMGVVGATAKSSLKRCMCY